MNESLKFCCHDIVIIRWVVGTCCVTGICLVGVVFMNPCSDFCLGLVVCLVWCCIYLCNVCFLGLYVDKDDVVVVSPGGSRNFES